MDIHFTFMVIHPGGQAIERTFGDGNDAKQYGLSLLLEEIHSFARAANDNPFTPQVPQHHMNARVYADMYMDLEGTEQSEWLATDLFNQTWALNIYMEDDAPADIPAWWEVTAQ